MIRLVATAALLTASAAAVAAPSQHDTARLLSGIRDGPPQRCIRERDVRGQTIIDAHTIVFERGHGRYWRNDVAPGCAALNPERSLATREVAIGICQGETFGVFDPDSRIGYGQCIWGPFVPYQRAAEK